MTIDYSCWRPTASKNLVFGQNWINLWAVDVAGIRGFMVLIADLWSMRPYGIPISEV